MEADVFGKDNSVPIEKFKTLLQIAIELEGSGDEEEAIDIVAHGIALLDYPNVMISLLFDNESPSVIRAVSAIGSEWELIKAETVRQYPGPDVLAKVLESGNSRFIPNSLADPDCNRGSVKRSGIATQYVVPLITSEMRIGTMQVHFPTCPEKPEIQCKMLDALAGHLSLSISRFRNLKKLHEAEDHIMSFTKFALTNEIAAITMHQVKEEIQDFYRITEEMMKDEKIRSNTIVFQKLKILQRKVGSLSNRAAKPLQFGMATEDFRICSVRDIVQDAISNWHDAAKIRGCRIKGDFRVDGISVHIRPSHLRELFSCLILNAIQAQAKRVDVIVTKEMDYCGERDRELCAVIRVSDDGVGIPSDIAGGIFDLGFTTKQMDRKEKGLKKGTGMGMFIAKRLANGMSGDIVVESSGKADGKPRTVIKLAIPLEED